MPKFICCNELSQEAIEEMFKRDQRPREMHEHVAAWVDGPLPMSKNDGWERWGLLGVLADYACWAAPGCVVEIGMGCSTACLAKVAKKYGRISYHCDPKHDCVNWCRYPGCLNEDSIVYGGISDDFLRDVVKEPVAVALIDGDHDSKQVQKDFNNLFALLSLNGLIFIHDTYPIDKTYIDPSASGDGYLVRQRLEEQRFLVDVFTFLRSAGGHGLTMVRKKPQGLEHFQK